MSATIHEGDALAILRTLPSDHYHGSLTDPPYGLSFMGHAWDHGVPSAEVWAEVLRCLRPGAHLLAFGGTRTFHRLACAIEDAGFEIRDCMQWLYATGFPKSLDVSKAIDREAGAGREVVGPPTPGGSGQGNAYGNITRPPATAPATQWSGHGTALKPAWEPIIVARKPLDGTVAENVQRWGCGGLAIDACRIESFGPPSGWSSSGSKASANLAMGGANYARDPKPDSPLGRWPANVILDEEAGAILDAQSGNRKSTLTGRADPSAQHPHPADPSGTRASMFGNGQARGGVYADSGGASRFFYCPKASRSERDAGLEEFEARSRAEATRRKEGSPGSKNAAAGAGGENCRNIHPTVKPIALARYLARLILPPIPDARMLTPFSGSGSEVIGALQAGWSHVDGIDSWGVAVRISRARIAHWSAT